MSTQVTVNVDQALYVISCGTGCSCLGFDVCVDRATKYAEWLTDRGVAAHAPEASERGSLDAYRQYRALIALVGELCTARRIRCDVELTPQLVGLENRRVDVVDRWSERKRFLVGKSSPFIWRSPIGVP